MTSDEFAARIVDMTPTLYRVSYSMLAQPCDREDAVSECLRKAWQMRSKLREDRYLQTWVVRILINECHNIQRRYAREMLTGTLPERAAPPDADAPLHDALMRLDGGARLPIVLHYIEGYSIREIAQILRLPQGTVKSRMLRGRAALREILSEGAAEL